MRAVLRHRFALILGLLPLAACKVGPDYTPPETRMPDAWTEEMKTGVVQGPAELAEWWTRFDDQTLTDLIERADRGNLDLAIALARIKPVPLRARHRQGRDGFRASTRPASAEYVKPSKNGIARRDRRATAPTCGASGSTPRGNSTSSAASRATSSRPPRPARCPVRELPRRPRASSSRRSREQLHDDARVPAAASNSRAPT